MARCSSSISEGAIALDVDVGSQGEICMSEVCLLSFSHVYIYDDVKGMSKISGTVSDLSQGVKSWLALRPRFVLGGFEQVGRLTNI